MTVDQAGLRRAVLAAIEGPGDKDIPIQEYSWNVDRADIQPQANGASIINGMPETISCRLPMRVDHQIGYSFKFEPKPRPRIRDPQLDAASGGTWPTVLLILELVWDNRDKIPQLSAGLGGLQGAINAVDELSVVPTVFQDRPGESAWVREGRFIADTIAAAYLAREIEALS